MRHTSSEFLTTAGQSTSKSQISNFHMSPKLGSIRFKQELFYLGPQAVASTRVEGWGRTAEWGGVWEGNTQTVDLIIG